MYFRATTTSEAILPISPEDASWACGKAFRTTQCPFATALALNPFLARDGVAVLHAVVFQTLADFQHLSPDGQALL